MGLVAHHPRAARRLLRGPVVDYARALRRIDMDSVKREEQQSYWDEVAATFGAEGQYDLWRRHSDRVNHDLLEAWLPGAPVARVLKTDLFDEAMSEGLYPLLARQAKRVDGVDISIQAVAAASARYPELQARYADLRQLPYTDGAFEAIETWFGELRPVGSIAWKLACIACGECAAHCSFKAIREKVSASRLPERSDLDQFIRDSEQMLFFPGYGNEYYPHY